METVQRIKDRWVGENCFLSGLPAKITGGRSDFATVAPLDPKYGTVEYSWQTVDRIMQGDRYFV
jgi:hypothetical protein